jgi:hypothetical protein
MKKSLLNLFGVLISASTLAQPVLNSSDLNYQIGMSYESSTAQYINPGPGGANVTWDFSAFTSSGTNVNTITAANPSFPNTTITGSSQANSEAYYQEDATGKYLWGIDAGGTIITYTDPSKILFYPLTYNASETNTFEATFFSGVNFTRAGTDEVTYDGYGTVITPNGTYNDVIRVALHQEYTDVYQGGTITYVVDAYTWYLAGYPDPVAAITEISVDGQPAGSNGFYSTNSSLALLSEESKSFEIYPNPATENINFKSLNNLEITEVKIVNSLGEIMIKNNQNNMILNDTKINVSDLENGVYFVQITGKNGMILSRKFIK